jgi:hypothetical protein
VNSSVGIVTRLWAGRQRSRGSIPSRVRDSCLLRNVKVCSGTQPASYKMSTGGIKASSDVKNGLTTSSLPLA